MLTKEVITANAALQGLSAEQIAAIETLSKNDENTVIAKKIGDLHSQYDADIEAVTGLKKDGGVKTYQYLKDVLGKFKTKAESADQLQSKITELETQLKDGKGHEALKTQLSDSENRFKQLQAKLEAEKANYRSQLEAEKSKFFQLKIDNEFASALSGVKFKDEKIIPQNVRETFIQAAKGKLLGQYKPDYIDDGKGGQRLVFRDENGQVANNPENALNPFTASELLKKEISTIIDTGHTQTGAGTKPNGTGGSGGLVDLSNATTQVQASEIITKALLEQGIAKTNPKFAEKQTEIWEENKIMDLPMR